MRILLLEDDPSYTQLVRHHLAGASWVEPEVEDVETLAAALKRLASPGIDLVISDLNVPDSRGTATIAALAAAGHQPIIAITADDEPGLREQAMRGGAYEFLPKHALNKASLERHVRLAAMQARALRSLIDSEARFRSLTEISSDWYWELDEDLRFVAQPEGERRNPSARAERYVGMTRWDAHPDSLTAAQWAEHRALLEAHQPFYDLEYERPSADGARRWVSVSGRPVFDENGAFRGYRGVGRDITERKRAERLLALEHRITLILSQALAEQDTVTEVIRAICESEDWDCGRYFVLDRAAGVMRFAQGWWPAGEATERFVNASRDLVFGRGDGLIGIVWQSGELMWVPDVSRDPRVTHRQLAHDNRVHGALVFPVTFEAEVIGVLSISSVTVREPDPRLQQTLRVIGSHLGQFMQRKRAETAMVQSEARFRSLTKLSSDWFWEQDEELRFTKFEGLVARAARSPQDALGKRRWDLNSRILSGETWDEHRRTLQAHLPFRNLELGFYDERSGALASVALISGEPVFDQAGRFRGYRGVGTDITAQKQADDALLEAKRRLELALEGSGAALWDIDLQTGDIYLSASWSALMESPAGDTRVTVNELKAILHADDLPRVREASIAALKGESATYDVEHRVRTTRGTWKWIHSRGKVIERDARGRALRMSGTNTDITERKRAEEALRQSEERLAKTFSASPNACCIVRLRDNVLLDINEGHTRLHGYSRQEAIGRTPLSLNLWADPSKRGAFIELVARQGFARNYEYQSRRKTGEIRTVLLSAEKVVIDGEACMIVVDNDITERKQGEETLRRYAEQVRDLYDNAPCGYHSLNPDGVFVQINDTELRWLGLTREEVIGKMKLTDILTSEGVKQFNQTFDAFKEQGGVRDLEFQLRRKDGSLMAVLLSSSAIREADGRFVMSRSTVYDITERKHAEERIRFLAQHDALTGLPNRLLFQDRVSQAIAQAHRGRKLVGVLFIDLDHFKHVNDSLGHQVGDRLLQAVAERLQRCLRDGDSVCRLGGDEFVISLPGLSDSQDAALVAAKVLDALGKPLDIDGRELHIGGSIGISVAPDDGVDPNTLMRAADTAMYHAKEKGRGNYRFFTAALNEAAQQRLSLANQLRQALARGEFVLHYQPQIDLETGRIFSVEALLRWQPPGKEPISCGDFISVAEETGLILPLGEWALREACSQLQRWRAAGHPEMQMAVNLSARQFYQSSFDEVVAQVLRASGLPAEALELEITESLLMLPSQENLVTLERLAAMGVRLSVDDFGMGYSSLAYLQRFPLHALKIDRSFVSGIGRDASHTAIVTAIIAMAQSLRLKVVAEGVENAEQVAFLKSRGCLAAQGYHYGRPMAADTFAAFLVQRPAEPVLRP